MRTISLLLLIAMLAGCTSDEPATDAVTRDDCLSEGMMLETVDGEPTCVEENAPATVALLTLDDAGEAYKEVAFSWGLDTHRYDAHAMMTQVRFSTESAVGNLSGPGSFGVLGAKFEHQDFTDSGINYTGTYEPQEAGTYYVRAYAEVFGQHLWSDEQTIEISAVQATGNSTTAIIPQAAIIVDPDVTQFSISLGDLFIIDNQDALEYTVTVTGPASIDDYSVGPQSTHPGVMLVVPGGYTFTASNGATDIAFSVNVS